MEENQNRLLSSLRLPFQFLLLIWGIHFLQVLSGFDFGGYGIFPREIFGLRGIVFSPLLHDDLRHLISNSAPLFFLAAMILYFYRRVGVR
ncbi:MAG: rhomboid family intramembrane serine protease, partial [Bacteroidota bacterium]